MRCSYCSHEITTKKIIIIKDKYYIRCQECDKLTEINKQKEK